MADENAPFDPMLKRAAWEIQRIFERYNIGGRCILVSPTHGEYLNGYHIPTWSCLKVDQAEEKLYFEANMKSAEDKVSERERCEATVHMLDVISRDADLCGKQADIILHELRKFFEIDRNIRDGVKEMAEIGSKLIN